MKRLFLTFIVSLALHPLASAWETVWVDPTFGDDAASGGGLDPVRTITRGLALLSGATEPRLRLWSGTFDAANGEQFPLDVTGVAVWAVSPGRYNRIVGVAGQPVLVANGPLELRQVTIVGGSDGLVGQIDGGPTHWELADVTFDGPAGAAMSLDASAATAAPIIDVDLDAVRVDGGSTGLRVVCQPSSWTSSLDVFARNTRVVGVSGRGFELRSLGAGGDLEVQLDRVLAAGCGLEGLVAESSGLFDARLQASSFETNGGDGVRMVTPLGGSVDTWFTTFAHNAGAGLSLSPTLAGFVRSSILWGNADDLSASAIVLEDNDIGDGDGAGSSGNFSLDPEFVNVAGGDFRLRMTSPCIDRLPNASATGDLNGVVRMQDGNLDTLDGADLGGYESVPLWASPLVRIGTDAGLEVQGTAGALSLVFVELPVVNTAPSSVSTPFGDLYLRRDRLALAGAVVHPGGNFAAVSYTIPNDLALIGEWARFQALTGAPFGPTARRLTNLVERQPLP